jgi:hypothetical protein
MCTVQLYGAACRVLVNHQFKDLFGSASELLERMQNENVTPPFMYASMVAAEDRLDFLEAMTKYLFGRTKEVELNQIVKIRDSMDVAFLAVIRLRVLTIAGGAYLATMLSVAPAPSSKYIRGGNRDGPHEGGLTWLGLNEAEGKFRLRPPAPPLTPGSDAGKDLENCNVEIERVREFVSAQQAAVGGAGGRGEGVTGGGGMGEGMGEKRVMTIPAPVVPSTVPQPICMQQHSHQLQQQQQQQQQPLLAMEVGGGIVGGGVDGERHLRLRPLLPTAPAPAPPPPAPHSAVATSTSLHLSEGRATRVVPTTSSSNGGASNSNSSSSNSNSSNGNNEDAEAPATKAATIGAAEMVAAAAMES